MRRRRPQRFRSAYHPYQGRRGAGGWLLPAVLLALLALAAGAWWAFRQELAAAGSLRRLDAQRPAYYMEIRGDYYFDEFLDSGGASSDEELAAFLSKKISKGFYTAPAGTGGVGCSVLSARGADGALLWGRNYDWTGAVPIIVRHIPREGYASLSTCDFQNITGSPKILPEGIADKFMAGAALYVPLDGVNEAGLCVADLEVNEGGMPDPDTEKPDLTVNAAIRLLLDRAGTVEEALALLGRYDIHPSGGISHHLAISDASGSSVSVEFTGDGFTAVPTSAVTNFNLAGGDPSSGGESARTRYEALERVYQEAEGVLRREEMASALAEVSQREGQWTTQWSLIYDGAGRELLWYFNGDFSRSYSYHLPD